MPLTPSPTALRRSPRARRWLAALLTLLLFPAMALADHGKGGQEEAVFLYTGTTKEGAEFHRLQRYPKSILLGYAEIITALTPYLSLEEEIPPPEEGPGNNPVCDQLLLEYWQAANVISTFYGFIADSAGAEFFDGNGEPTNAYYLLVGRMQTIAREQGRAAAILGTMTAMGCENIPNQPL